MIARRPFCPILLFICSVLSSSSALAAQLTARIQHDFSISQLDDDDLLAEAVTDQPQDYYLQLRLMLDSKNEDFHWSMHYQLQAGYSDRLEAMRLFPGSPLLEESTLIDDTARFFDMSYTLHQKDEVDVLQRIDRLYIGHNGRHLSWKLGRYAVSWGNGLAYSVLDIFNPFDPAAIDREYKTGDDMLYMQYLLSTGNDIQLLLIPRRETDNRQLRADQSSLAIKYHAIVGTMDYDLLVAQHYDETLVGAGFAWDISGLLWRGDFSATDAGEGYYHAMLSSLNYAWSWYEKPVNGFIEVYYNEVGVDGSEGYQLSSFASNTALIDRLARGEIYTLGQRYLAIGIDFEAHPLVRISPSVFTNLDDHSKLMQVALYYDLRQNFSVTTGFNFTSGKRGSEYGGIETGINNTTLSAGDSWFLLVNTYF